MENPSLRMCGSGSNTSTTFIAENYREYEYGLWAIDESTGKHGYVEDERSCFWKYDDNEYVWQSRPFERRQVKRRKWKGKGKGKSPGRFKRIRNAYLDEEQKQDNDWRTEQDSVWWSKEKAFQKGKNKFPECDSRSLLQDKNSDKEFQSNNGTNSFEHGTTTNTFGSLDRLKVAM